MAYVDDVAAFFGKKPKAFRAAIARGKFPAGRIIGGRRCWVREDLVPLLEAKEEAGPSLQKARLMKVCTRPSPHNPERVQVDMRFSCPDPRSTKGKNLRIQRTAPEGYTADTAMVWARENADRFLAEIFGETRKERGQEEESKPEARAARVPEPETDPGRVVTLEHMYKHMEDRVISHEEPTSRETWASVWRRHLQPKFGQMPLDLITKTRILDYREELQKRYAPSTCNHIIVKLQGILSYAVEKEKLAGVPTIKRLKTRDAAEKDPYTDEEMELLLAAAEGDEIGTLALLLSLDAGLRRNEMLALRWCDVDLRNSEVHIRHSMHRTGLKCPKGKKAVSVPMRARLRSELAKARKDRKLTDHVFPGERNAWMSESAFRNHMIELAGRAGVEWRGFHKAKHTFITLLLEKGANLQELQLLARHKHASTTEGYMHVRNAAKAMKAGIARLDEGVPAPTPTPTPTPERVRPKLRMLSS
ncbi:tyrosine-type recombinase/integrase [Nannocystis punicea]|uniref:Tyrosine-type recombinase/integrase n=1 Tax=Nannocystis punicea TaxID=2995304 RepID=A0ABY7GY03_9BACT|nr:tyrosine-type recombinase/integrase [Nannocystis poenicansa]WAS91831.1 tyrosine-type recombinase/integrase [Nannocystis poenicansa]